MNSEILQRKLKEVTDTFINILHELLTLYFDANQALDMYSNYLQQTKFTETCSFVIYDGEPNDRSSSVLHHSSCQEAITRNKKNGKNIDQIKCFIVCMIYEYWDNKFRKDISKILGLKNKNELKYDIFGDLRNLRNDIIHNFNKSKYSYKNKILTFKKGDEIKILDKDIKLIVNSIIDLLNQVITSNTKAQPYKDYSLHPEAKSVHTSILNRLFPINSISKQ